MLCFMWQNNQSGMIAGTKSDLCRMLGITAAELDAFFNENKRLKIADVTGVTKRNKKVTVINRRMYNKYKEREATRLRVRKHRNNAKCNKKETSPSSSSSSSSPFLREKVGTHDVCNGAEPNEVTQTPVVPPLPSDAANLVVGLWNGKTGNSSRIVPCDKLDGITKSAIEQMLKAGIELGAIAEAIDNYAQILNGAKYWWNCSWELRDFIDKGLRRFMSESDPFLKFTGAKATAAEDEFSPGLPEEVEI